MITDSREASALTRCSTVRLFVYSGRPDPEFELDDDAAADLLERLGRIPQGQRPEAIEAVAPPPPQLGYRGLLVRLAESDVDRVGAKAASPPQPHRGGTGTLSGSRIDQVLVYGGVIRFRREGRQYSWRDTTGIEQGLLEEAVRRGHQDLLESVGVRVAGPAPEALPASAGGS